MAPDQVIAAAAVDLIAVGKAEEIIIASQAV